MPTGATEIGNSNTAADLKVSGDLTITGDDLFMATNTLGTVLVGDGTNFNPVVMGGDASIAADGTVTLANNSHIQIFMDYPDGMAADTAWVFTNFHSATVTIDSIHAESSVNGADFAIWEKNWSGGGSTLVDVVTTSTAGTNCFYSTETAITAATIEAGHKLGLLRPNDASDYVLIVIYYH